MAEFPYPEYRNLYLGSKLSEDRLAVVSNAWQSDGGVQTPEGLELTFTSTGTGAQSPAYTRSTAYRVPTIDGKAYSLAVPIKNTGAITMPARITAYLEHAAGSLGASTGVVYIQPGETRALKVENVVAPSGSSDIRWSLRVDANDPRPPVGGKLLLMDGITLVQSATAPDFPFNGDGAKPIETVSRRNVALPLSAWDTSGASLSELDDGWTRLESSSTSGYISTPSPYHTAVKVEPGKESTEAITVRVPDDAPAAEVEMAAFFYTGSGGELTESRTTTGRITVAPGEARDLSLDLDVPSVASGARQLFYLRNAKTVDLRAPFFSLRGEPFDGDTAPSGNLSYRWENNGQSVEVETVQPPTGRTYSWDGEPYKSTSTAWVGDSAHATGVMDVGIATEARLGIVSDIYSRSREKIQLELARVDSQLIAGERVELDAAAMTASPVVWHWRQVNGPAVELEPREASMDFIAPDVDEDTPVRIAVYAASEDGRNRSDWHYFDLTIKPPFARYRSSESGEFEPVSPKYVGYDRGKREIWNDVIPPSGFSPNARHETEIIDLGILPDDVQFTTDGPPEVAAAGGIYVDLETGDIYRNFGAGYNETDDTTAAPRTNAWWVNPATGDILEWIED